MTQRTLRPLVYELNPLIHKAAFQSPTDSFTPEVHVAGLLRALEERPGLVALDSVGGSPADWTIIGIDPFEDYSGLRDFHGPEPRDPGPIPRTLAELKAALAGIRSESPPSSIGPFAGGFLGALSYDLGVHGEGLGLPAPAWPQPPIVGGLYRDWIVIEHGQTHPGRRVRLIVSEDSQDGDDARRRAQSRARSLLELLTQAQLEPQPSPSLDSAAPAKNPSEWRTVSRAEHCRRVEQTRQLIAAGEIYQANIAHRMVAPAPADALGLYLRLRETNPAPYMGFLRFASGDHVGSLLSSSPELLAAIGTNRQGDRIARTRPIKGTIGRGATAEEDQLQRHKLLSSQKDRAELAMIVDLERNDLGRIAVPGGVQVAGFPTLETYAAVHHLVADVRARIAPDQCAVDVVSSLFPGGSITGAPKLRSMEVIAELEQEGRGFFTGSMGMIDARGEATLSILIRTMIHRSGSPAHGAPAQASFHVGGGITWNSDPLAEDEETLLKAEGMLRALTSV